jgi:hypothetical protein
VRHRRVGDSEAYIAAGEEVRMVSGGATPLKNKAQTVSLLNGLPARS